MPRDPYPLTGELRDLTIKGFLCPFESATTPLRFSMGGEDEFIGIFSTKQRLDEFIAISHFTYVKIVQIQNGPAFLDSVMGHYRVAIDPHRHENGRIRFTEALPPTNA